MAQISLILIENCSIFDCEDDCGHDCEHEIVVRTFLDGAKLVAQIQGAGIPDQPTKTVRHELEANALFLTDTEVQIRGARHRPLIPPVIG